MLKRFLRPTKRFYSINVPFQDELTEADSELFGLEDFKYYKEAKPKDDLENAVSVMKPMVFVSQMSDPYLNLAIEDYIYNKMSPQSPRLLFYINSPCVVIGKNQNPWKEVNLPLLNNLKIPLLRRKLGGGTVVHDNGNVNFLFMTNKHDFSRFDFVNLICNAVNSSQLAKYPIKVNDRGDIVTDTNLKVSGSAYKLSRGKSYHHGTMLLNLKLDILGKLLSTSYEKNGHVTSTTSVNSVKSKVANIEMTSPEFIATVSEAFRKQYASEETFTITKDTLLNDEILAIADELKAWSWKFGKTPKFRHEFTNGFKLVFQVDKEGVLEDFELHDADEAVHNSFLFLRVVLDRGERVEYRGSDVAGFVTDDYLSDWVGETIDGTS